jgi:hypothetical protein
MADPGRHDEWRREMRTTDRVRRLATAVAVSLAVPVLAVVTAAPAQAAVEVEGYVWGYQPAAAQYVANSGYEHNSAGQPVVVTRTGTGAYQVQFRGMGAAGGVAHATAYGLTSDFCTVAGTATRGRDQHVAVRCFDHDGDPADSMFVANYSTREPAAGTYARLWSHDPVPPAAGYVPTDWFDSTGVAPHITRTAVGRYQVRLGALFASYPHGHTHGHLRATSYGSAPVRCEVLDPRFTNPLAVPVRCYDHDGFAADSRFMLTLAHEVNLLGVTPPYGTALLHPQPVGDPVVGGWTNAGGQPTALRLGVGRYQVSYPGLGMPFGHAMANAFGTPPAYCQVVGWWQAGADQQVRVDCRAPDGSLTDVWAFQLTMNR